MRNALYFFLANAPFSHKGFEASLSSFELPFRLHFDSDRSGTLLAPLELGTYLSTSLFTIHDDLGATVTLLEAPKDSPLLRKLLPEALSYFPNQVVALSDVLAKEMSFGNFGSVPLLANEFKDVPHELLLTAGAFLRANLNASLTAEILYIHRNTFNYRLNAFIEKTGLDIRQYHNALLLEFYFQFCAQNRGN